jgi:hypothetical protein
MDLRYGSSGTVPALQVQRPNFKPQSHPTSLPKNEETDSEANIVISSAT